jgi:hypothetical protein
LIAAVTPQQGRQLVAQVRLPRLHGEIRQQGLGLLAGKDNRPGTMPNLEASKEGEVKPWHCLLVQRPRRDRNMARAAISRELMPL